MVKYLKYRKDRQMNDPATYCKIATAIAETIKVQEKLDGLFAQVEKNIVN